MITKAIWKILYNGSFDVSVSQFSETRNITCREQEVPIKNHSGENGWIWWTGCRKGRLNLSFAWIRDREQAKGTLDKCDNYYKMCRHIESGLSQLWCLNCTTAGDQALEMRWWRCWEVCVADRKGFVTDFSKASQKAVESDLVHPMCVDCSNFWEGVRPRFMNYTKKATPRSSTLFIIFHLTKNLGERLGVFYFKANAWEVEEIQFNRQRLTKDVEDKRPAQCLWD